MSCTPRKSRWSDNEKNACGIIACVSSSFHFPSARNFHFWEAAVLCILHPDDRSKSVITLSTKRNSQRLLIAGLRSSQYAYSTYPVSRAERTGRWFTSRGGRFFFNVFYSRFPLVQLVSLTCYVVGLQTVNFTYYLSIYVSH